ncbi:hypothetical protein M2408_000331 [Sphingobacterium sp. BIGb0165]|nr:hypothetical protein [Sphingobacterium sp. BIGb0165]
MHSIYLNQFGIVLNRTYAIQPFFFETIFLPYPSKKKEVIYFTKSPLPIFIYFLYLYLYLSAI